MLHYAIIIKINLNLFSETNHGSVFGQGCIIFHIKYILTLSGAGIVS